MRITANAQNTHFEDGYEAFFNDFDAFQAVSAQKPAKSWGIPHAAGWRATFPVKYSQ